MLAAALAAPFITVWQHKLLMVLDRLLHMFGICLGG